MISFVRIDDRIIHGQVVLRWAKEFPCDGIIVVNDKVATTPVLSKSFKASTDKRVLIFTKEKFKEKQQEILDSKKRYFLITKDPIDMATILVDYGFVPSAVKRIIVGPANDRPGSVKLGQNQSIIPEEAEALEAISQKGYDIEFALVPESNGGSWKSHRSKFGY